MSSNQTKAIRILMDEQTVLRLEAESLRGRIAEFTTLCEALLIDDGGLCFEPDTEDGYGRSLRACCSVGYDEPHAEECYTLKIRKVLKLDTPSAEGK